MVIEVKALLPGTQVCDSGHCNCCMQDMLHMTIRPFRQVQSAKLASRLGTTYYHGCIQHTYISEILFNHVNHFAFLHIIEQHALEWTTSTADVGGRPQFCNELSQ